MKRPQLIAAALVAILSAGAGIAHAAPLPPNPVPALTSEVVQIRYKPGRDGQLMPRRAVIRSLYQRGFRDVRKVRFQNGFWRARALGRRGVVALKINPRNGRIVKRNVVRQFGPGHRWPRPMGNGKVIFKF